ncbi:MAG: phenylalanine--tRNA ligase subunit beta [Caedimonas sp.]|nr:phenylalanine--tRNA ligase subunit beta [Caedimonas sp.]
MKFTLSWLREHLETDASLQDIALRLTKSGLLVDTIINPADALRGFRIAEILEALPHPKADRLKVCRVNTGAEVLQVVCGAPNARAGLKSVLAVPGMTIPTSGLVLRKSIIRDVESAGMMCSMRELGLGDSHEGIIELPTDAPTGEEFAVYKELDDPVIDIEITPNRGDCLSVRGIARDLAATHIGTLKSLNIPVVKSHFKTPLQIEIQDLTGCPFFTGRLIRNVKNGPSPRWLQKKLEAIGLKPISSLVDITNFMAYDRGRPMHAFDADRLQGDLVIRQAKPGDLLHALDDHTYHLPSSAIVIADQQGPCSIAGIMGGMASGCSEETINVFVESALFDPIRIALTGRALGILSDSRYRFERGVDPAIVEEGLEQATQMILNLCGGEPGEIVRVGDQPLAKRTICFHASRVKTLGGLDLPQAKTHEILERLGFSSDGEHTLKVPSWRPDIKGEADLVEEVLRIQGYDAIQEAELPQATPEDFSVNPTSSTLSPLQASTYGSSPSPSSASKASASHSKTPFDRTWKIRRGLVKRGMSEVYTWSFLKREWAVKFGGGDPTLTIENPISADMSDMRPSLLPLLLETLRRNTTRGHKNLALFEVGHQYHPEIELLATAGIRGFVTGPRHWLESGRQVDVFDAKADAYTTLESCGFDPSSLQVCLDAPSWYHPGRSGVLKLGPKTRLAQFGELHPHILELFDLTETVVAFEVFVDAIPTTTASKRNFLPLSPYQPVERDFAFVVDLGIPAQKLVELIQKVNKILIKSVSVFDVYQGAGIPEGKKSLAISVRLEPQEATLTETEIMRLSRDIIEAMQKHLGAELRS